MILDNYDIRHTFKKLGVFTSFFYLFSSAALSQTLNIEMVPAGWRLENYPANSSPSSVSLWFTTSGCTNGHLELPASATNDDANRLWSTILSAKMSNRSIGINYTKSGESCAISSFYFP